NGNKVLGLARNVGEVLGVFAVFHPRKDPARVLGVNYVDDNSANFRGLKALEDLIGKIGPPKWPWAVDQALAARGKQIFDRTCAKDWHEIKTGALRSIKRTWATPIWDVGTDSRERNLLTGMVDTGVLAGAQIPFAQPLAARDTAFNVLRTAVTGSI